MEKSEDQLERFLKYKNCRESLRLALRSIPPPPVRPTDHTIIRDSPTRRLKLHMFKERNSTAQRR